jgi:hypothetical protein
MPIAFSSSFKSGARPQIRRVPSGARPLPGNVIPRGGSGGRFIPLNGRNPDQVLQAFHQAKAIRAGNEAKQKSEASKGAALGGFDDAAASIAAREGDIRNLFNKSLAFFKPLADQASKLAGPLISPEQEAALLANRRASLAAAGQNRAGLFTDPDSGVQSGVRREIARNTALSSANLPIDIRLQVARENRDAIAQGVSAGSQIAGQFGNQTTAFAGALSRLNQGNIDIARGKAGVHTAFDYDPGSKFSQELGFGLGQQSGGGGGGSGTSFSSSGGASFRRRRITSSGRSPHATGPRGTSTRSRSQGSGFRARIRSNASGFKSRSRRNPSRFGRR